MFNSGVKAELINASKEYKSGDTIITALQPTDFQLKQGELTLILGPSGSGKTTLISLIGCVIYPSNGEVYINGQNVTKKKEHELADPKVQEIAAYRDETLVGHYNDLPHKFDGKRYGGYYTHEEVRQIVSYAAQRNIVVIPEIEMPGHAQAAISAYPELGCEDKEYKVATKWGVFEDVFCPYERTFEFLEDVIDEVIALFPGKYIHIGGDECPKNAWKKNAHCQQLIGTMKLKDEHGLQSYFIQRMEKYINSKGKQIIGWDEILEGGLAPKATVMSWRGIQGGMDAARLHHEVILTPGTHCYFDHYQSEYKDEPLETFHRKPAVGRRTDTVVRCVGRTLVLDRVARGLGRGGRRNRHHHRWRR